MAEIQSFFKRLKTYYASNPYFVWAAGWVSLAPSLFSLITLNFLYSHQAYFFQFQASSWEFSLLYIGFSSLLISLALLPTTFFAVVSGFLFGWITFPYLVLGYTLATVIGYGIGRRLDQD